MHEGAPSDSVENLDTTEATPEMLIEIPHLATGEN